MNLFDSQNTQNQNLLPTNGTVNYWGRVFDIEQANHFYENLMQNIEWKNDQAVIYGKTIVTKRKVAWYGDSAYTYTYSNTTKTALPWTEDLIEIKKIIENKTKESFNSCLLNLYHNGDEGMTWHSDAEKDLVKNASIASVSFGAVRKFSFKNKSTSESVSLILEHGSLLVMKDETQTYWLHRLPTSKLVTKPRISLTFRTIK